MASARERVKVVHYIVKWLPQTATWMHHQVQFLPAEVENFVVCNSTENLSQFAVPNIHSLEKFPQWPQFLQRAKAKLRLSTPMGRHLPLLEQVILRVRPDILHTHFGHWGWVNSKLALQYGIKHVVSFYGADVNHVPHADPRWFPRYREMGSRVDRVLCEGPYMADSIAALGIPRSKVKVHRLGVDLSKIRFEPRRYEKGQTLRFLIVGSYREKKGIPYALEALALFARQFDNFEITVIGDADQSQREQAEKAIILQTVKECNLGPRVRILGEQPYDVVLKEAYRHHIFLSPSLVAGDKDCEGGAPVAIIEMAASGMPIVGTRHCDIPFVLSEENAPYLVAERDSKALCGAITRLVECDWQNLVARNRKFVEEQLDVRKQGQRLLQAYQDLI